MPKFIAVEGPIGVGKTTLAKKLSEAFDYPLMLEPVTENPFLDRFYTEAPVRRCPHNSSFSYTVLDRLPISLAMIFSTVIWFVIS